VSKLAAARFGCRKWHLMKMLVYFVYHVRLLQQVEAVGENFTNIMNSIFPPLVTFTFTTTQDSTNDQTDQSIN
jgi:hypothetical protein